MTINNCEGHTALHRQDIYSPQWRILCVMMHVTYNIAFTATDVTFNILTSLKAIYLKYQATGKLLNQVISIGFQVSN